ANPLVGSNKGLATLITDNTTLLLVRAIVFGIFPLIFATRSLRASGAPLTRKSLRPFFYAQCLPTGAFALLLSVGITLSAHPIPRLGYAGAVLTTGAILYYLVTQTRWFADHPGRSYLRGFGHAVFAFVLSWVAVIAVSAMLVL
ncbi:MAG: hypothetical protein AVDCRST_MAG93-9306, partial [uncultured Chloroflexia bacterium]